MKVYSQNQTGYGTTNTHKKKSKTTRRLNRTTNRKYKKTKQRFNSKRRRKRRISTRNLKGGGGGLFSRKDPDLREGLLSEQSTGEAILEGNIGEVGGEVGAGYPQRWTVKRRMGRDHVIESNKGDLKLYNKSEELIETYLDANINRINIDGKEVYITLYSPRNKSIKLRMNSEQEAEELKSHHIKSREYKFT
jgi:hypothetical protein